MGNCIILYNTNVFPIDFEFMYVLFKYQPQKYLQASLKQ